MSKRTWGILAGIMGSAIGAWYMSQRSARARAARHLVAPREHGTVIFDNTPAPSEVDSFM